eukprot:NODE_1990_length_1166_cov_48.465833_g1973_i0.p1 GENE.NODE_1990_length_1166_cov_48.465833_g1973_i0~~NODE_1990_length_1166_cov_48.465833_g1973_i0.p1  ORF type:complete len:377 (+),score=32.25 NODE_1990_length_1166_cov_48.465833_g1973_i0:76-1131(+)
MNTPLNPSHAAQAPPRAPSPQPMPEEHPPAELSHWAAQQAAQEERLRQQEAALAAREQEFAKHAGQEAHRHEQAAQLAAKQEELHRREAALQAQKAALAWKQQEAHRQPPPAAQESGMAELPDLPPGEVASQQIGPAGVPPPPHEAVLSQPAPTYHYSQAQGSQDPGAQAPPQVAPQLGNICTKCSIRPANPGRKWCQECFTVSQGHPAQPQHTPPPAAPWPVQQRPMAPQGGGQQCTKCRYYPANPGKSWCQRCYDQSQPTSPTTPPLYPPQYPQPQTCAKCHRAAANPGHTWCQACYRASTGKCTSCNVYPATLGHSMCAVCHAKKPRSGKAQGANHPGHHLHRNPFRA